jgi:hypothetical protein
VARRVAPFGVKPSSNRKRREKTSRTRTTTSTRTIYEIRA